MKVFLLVLFALLVGTLNAQNDGVGTIVGQWAGDTSTSTLTFRAPVNVPCNQAATATTYVAINTTFAVAGVREVALLAESSFKGAVTVYLYAGTFNPLTSCDSNFVRQLRNSNFGATSLIIDDPVFFEAGTNYIFVVSSTSTTNNGKFVLQVWGSVGGGSTTATSPTWNPSAYNNGCVLQTSINQTMGIVQWTQATTGNYDLIGMFDVAAATGAPSSSIYWTLYAGTFSAADIAANPCGTTIGTSFRTNANEGDRTAAAWNVQLTQNQPYTVAISNTYNGNFAFNVFPTRLARISSVAGFNQPNTAPPCAASSNTDAPYYIYPIPSSAVTGPFYIVDTEELFAYLAPAYVNFDTRSFAYSGTVTAPPAACPAGNTFLGSADTGDTNGPLIFNTTAGQAYSVVVSDFTGAALTDANSAIYVWAFTGTPIGGAAATTGATTGAATTGATTAGTTGAVTTGTANATTSAPTTSTTTSPASTLAASAFLAFAGTLALLL